jgi:uncharacterized protein YlxW (UPF0749 family)
MSINKNKKVRNRSVIAGVITTASGTPFATLYGLQATNHLPHISGEALLGVSFALAIVVALVLSAFMFLFAKVKDAKDNHEVLVAKLSKLNGLVTDEKPKEIKAEIKAYTKTMNTRAYNQRKYHKAMKKDK